MKKIREYCFNCRKIEESNDVHRRRGKVYKKKEQTRIEKQGPTQIFSGLVNTSNSEEISEVNAYDIGTKFKILNTKNTKCVLCDGK